MSHFYGTLNGSRGEATRCGTKGSGMLVRAASWGGAIEVELHHDAQGRDVFVVSMIPWQGTGDRKLLAEGEVGDASSVFNSTLDR